MLARRNTTIPRLEARLRVATPSQLRALEQSVSLAALLPTVEEQTAAERRALLAFSTNPLPEPAPGDPMDTTTLEELTLIEKLEGSAKRWPDLMSELAARRQHEAFEQRRATQLLEARRVLAANRGSAQLDQEIELREEPESCNDVAVIAPLRRSPLPELTLPDGRRMRAAWPRGARLAFAPPWAAEQLRAGLARFAEDTIVVDAGEVLDLRRVMGRFGVSAEAGFRSVLTDTRSVALLWAWYWYASGRPQTYSAAEASLRGDGFSRSLRLTSGDAPAARIRARATVLSWDPDAEFVTRSDVEEREKIERRSRELLALLTGESKTVAKPAGARSYRQVSESLGPMSGPVIGAR